MTSSGPHPEQIRAGTQTFQRWMDLEVHAIVTQLQDIDPNLVLVRAPKPGYPDRWGVLWNGPDAQWHAVCFNDSGTRSALQALPSVLRERDRNSPTNSRVSAWERDVAEGERLKAEHEDNAVAQLTDDADRVYHALRKDDAGVHLGLTKKRFVSVNPSKVDSWD